MSLRTQIARTALLALTVALPLSATSFAASAATLDFEDLTPSTRDAEGMILDGYSGFTWTNIYVTTGARNPGSAYGLGAVAGPTVAFNAWAGMASFASSSAFRLHSFTATAAWMSTLSATFNGYLGGDLVQSITVTLSNTLPTEISTSWLIDRFEIVGPRDSNSHIALDRIVYDQVAAVPLPGALALGLTGLGALGLVARRRRSSAQAA